ncbi:unnamed protein product [Ceutorhynchus assimilis]|uniref:Pyridoxal phosphate phosphatase PHOSPHO2 n=1 Tax=Ceutorhynchus assimilis TaxID=467358 RepID=A0A9N9MT74_9CUCU|nr:unnamed protein product [Ceutorhynchus assimilis]
MNNFLRQTFLRIFASIPKKKPKIMKNLAVFDFDHTIIDDNSDTAVMKLVDKSKFSPQLKELHKEEGWTAFMQGVFDVLHENRKTELDISKLIENISEVSGVKNLIIELHDNMDYDVIIISDSNTYFIEHWLQQNNLSSKILKVFSNPAEFDQNGLLKVEMYHIQDSCKLSTRNMCKGMIMEDFIKAQSKLGIIYNKIAYVGDGQNDFCPILRLNDNGIACCRDNFKCVELVKKAQKDCPINENDKTKYKIKAQLCVWQNGQDILDFLRKSI